MDEKQRQVLQKCHDYLIEEIKPLPITDSLCSAGVLSNDDVIRLRKKATPNDKNRLLLVHMLPKAGPNALTSLLLRWSKRVSRMWPIICLRS